MKTKLILCLALVLSGELFSYSAVAQDSTKSSQWPGPTLPPITNANSLICHPASVRLPTRLKVERTADTLSVTIDTNSFETATLMVGTNMVTGVRSEWYVYPVGQARPAKSGVGFSDLLDFDLGGIVNYWHTKPDGIPQVGKIYIVEIDLAVFETDIPPQHMWDPRGGKFRILWQRTLKQIVK